ncbi:MAG: YqgE/AlgH family protein [Mycobacteriaceae bacterium]
MSDQDDVVAGSLLVSSTTLVEPTFRRTVIYVVDHSPTGSLGLVLNRPSDTAVVDVLAGWAPLARRPQALFVGGPVSQESALCLATVRVGASAVGVTGLRVVQGRVVMVDLDADPEPLAAVVDGVRVFAGYTGWSPQQLDSEIARGDWLVVTSLPGDVLDPGRGDLWAQVLRRQPMPTALLATHPLDVDRS